MAVASAGPYASLHLQVNLVADFSIGASKLLSIYGHCTGQAVLARTAI